MPCRIIILGAGLHGLSCAWYLKKKFGSKITIKILEKSHRSGGWIKTIHLDSFLFEQGPHSCRSKGNGLETLQLIEELDLQEEVILADPSAQFRFLYYQKKMQKLPSSLWTFLNSPLSKGMLPALFWELFQKKNVNQDESIYHFFSRKFSPEIAERLIDPLISGIYAGDMHKLSLKACFPRLFEMEQQYGSLVKGMLFKKKQKKTSVSAFVQEKSRSPIFSFKNGMQTLPDRLFDRVEAEILLNSQASCLKVNEAGISLETNNKDSMQADYLISTIPAYSIGELLGETSLKKIPYSSVTVVNLGYKQNVLNQKGFGYLIPKSEGEAILGCIWDSSVFPEQNQNKNETRLTVMMKQAESSQLTAIDALNKHLGITYEPDVVSVYEAKNAIPQYEVGYSKLKEEIYSTISKKYPRVILSGQAFDGVSINDSIAAAKQLANNFVLN